MFNNQEMKSKIFTAQNKQIIWFGSLMTIIFLLLFFIEPLIKLCRITNFNLNEVFIIYIIVVCLLLFALVVYHLTYRQLTKTSINIKVIFFFFILFNLILLFIWPITTTDLFSYIAYSRVFSQYQANPLTTPYANFSTDLFRPYLFNDWSVYPTPYAPLFIYLTSFLNLIGGVNFILTVFIYKLFFVLANLFTGYLIYKIWQNPLITFLYCWHPLINFEIAANAHNDILTLIFLVISLYFLFKKTGGLKNYSLTWCFLILSALIKFIPFIFLPILFLVIWKQLPDKHKISYSLLLVLLVIILLLIFFLPFLSGNTFNHLFLLIHSNHPLLIANAPLIIILAGLLKIFRQYDFLNLAILISKFFFLLFYTFLIIKLALQVKKLEKVDFIKYSVIALLIFLFAFVNFIYPWYILNLIVLLILLAGVNKDNKFYSYVFYLSIYAITLYIYIR